MGQRKEIVSADTNSFRVINHKRDYNGMLFCQMIYFEPGRSQAYITLNDDAESYALDALTNEALNNIEAPAEREQHRKEFVDSFLYFGVFENHLVVLQSSALRSRELEAHLGWLIGISVKDFAVEHSLDLHTTYQVLAGTKKGKRGEAHRAAVLLGIKEGTVAQ